MNVLNRLTLRYLRLNRTRTLVTVIGVILSAAMFSAVTTFAVSLQQGLIRSSIALYGDWEGSLDNIPSVSYTHLDTIHRNRYTARRPEGQCGCDKTCAT